MTTQQEKQELTFFRKNDEHIFLIGNVPNYDEQISGIAIRKNSRKVFGTVALIGSMKNFHKVIEALQEIEEDVDYLIYGPIVETSYWRHCQQLISTLPVNIRVRYMSEIDPARVSQVMRTFDFYIQPSQSENFGHSLFEAFNQGIPVITSHSTPWNELFGKQAGWNVDADSAKDVARAVQEALELSPESKKEFSKGARNIAVDYMNSNDLKTKYKQLFTPRKCQK